MKLGSGNSREKPRTGARHDLRERRFQTYFPRLFAYLCTTAGDDETARDLAVHTFTEAFSFPDMREHEFELHLFRLARALSQHPRMRRPQLTDGLTVREHEVISLVFDAQMERTQIAQVLGVTGDTVASSLVSGLRKMQSSPDGIPSRGVPPAFHSRARA
jgi:DNA-directed RNA polymerase specialized sigma24 family protein